MALNATWHRAHPMPRPASDRERLRWHVQHQKHCGCRPMPAGLARMAGKRAEKARLAKTRISAAPARKRASSKALAAARPSRKRPAARMGRQIAKKRQTKVSIVKHVVKPTVTGRPPPLTRAERQKMAAGTLVAR